MGFFDFLKNLFKRKNKFDKLTITDVADSIFEIERQEESLEKELEDNEKQIALLNEKGRTEPSHQRKILYATKIEYLMEASDAIMQRIMHAHYNMKLLNKLKIAIEDKGFYMGSQPQALSALLADRYGLMHFLNKVYGEKKSKEEEMVEVEETFNMIKNEFQPNERIHGISKGKEAIMASWENSVAAEVSAEVGKLNSPNSDKVKSSNKGE